MPPIITVDTYPTSSYIDAHHSTYALTTLLHNDQLILLEVQGTLEYNLTNEEKVGEIKLGDISWDETVCSVRYLYWWIGIESVSTYWTSQDGWTITITQDTSGRAPRQTRYWNFFSGRQRMAAPYNNTKEARVRHTSRTSIPGRTIIMTGIEKYYHKLIGKVMHQNLNVHTNT